MSTLDSLEIFGKRVFLRCDLNVPLKDGVIVDDGRIKASLPTIKFLLKGGASLVIGAHLGRPKGEIASEFSLAPVAERLRILLDQDIVFRGGVTPSVMENARPGQIQLLENLRFNPAETSKIDSERGNFAAEIAKNVDCYVGDGFGAVHRKHASVFDLPQLLPHAPGFLVSAEVEVLKKLTQEPARPYGVVLGGSKVSDKIAVI
ncbi:MAG: phosphoglycerate kinase, partial [Actinobacteria bacterium]|nr:phosphoglycerate kinase [Actinomycetota bacterium]